MAIKTVGEIMRQHGSDKGGPHGYGPVYDSLFHDRDKVERVLELGIANGCSLRGWQEAFPNAIIVGMDARLCFVPGERIRVYRGDQRNPQDLLPIAREGPYDLIVDDASHIMADQLFSLFVLWPHLKEGGYYVIEEFDAPGGLPRNRWPDNLMLLLGVKIIETIADNGVIEPLIVIRK